MAHRHHGHTACAPSTLQLASHVCPTTLWGLASCERWGQTPREKRDTNMERSTESQLLGKGLHSQLTILPEALCWGGGTGNHGDSHFPAEEPQAQRGTETLLWLLNKWKTLDQNPNLLESLPRSPAPQGSWPRPRPCHTNQTHTIWLGWCQEIASPWVIPTDQELKNAG